MCDGQILEFKAKNVIYKMMKVFPTQNNRQNILTPCIVFYYSNDEVQFSSLSILFLNSEKAIIHNYLLIIKNNIINHNYLDNFKIFHILLIKKL